MQNGTIGDAIKLPVGSRPSQLGLNNEEDVVPVVAFKERRSLRTLTGLEEIQTHQRAGEKQPGDHVKTLFSSGWEINTNHRPDLFNVWLWLVSI